MKIKGKITLPMVGLILCLVCILSAIAVKISNRALENTVKTSMATISNQGVKIVTSRVEKEKDRIELLAAKEEIKDVNKTNEEKFNILSEYVNKYNYMKMGITDLNGNIVYSNGKTLDISEREYFKEAKSGQVSVSDPLISAAEKKLVVVYMAPIINNGKIVGFLSATKEGDDISSISKDITFGQTGKVFIIKNDGVKIAHYNDELVMKEDNDLENVKKDSSLKDLVDLENKMIKGEKGDGEYTYKGVEKYMYYTPIEGTTWSLAAVVNKDEIFSETKSIQRFIAVVAVIFILLAIAIVYTISNKIGKNLKIATDYLMPISEGNLSFNIDDNHLKISDETGDMIRAINHMKVSIKEMIITVINNSDQIFNNSKKLYTESKEMDSSSKTVVEVIRQVAEGTTAQAQDLVAINETIDDFSKNLDNVLKSILEVGNESKGVIELTGEGKRQFKVLANSIKNMTKAFDMFKVKIENSSHSIQRINEITSLINSISEETTLLSLNAAIEAARAGESGRGFSVVADHIRQLSEESKKSADNITEIVKQISTENDTMIDTTKKINDDFELQKKAVEETIASFNNISSSIENIMPHIEKVSSVIDKINDQKATIIDNVEATSAVAEENSAASEEIFASTNEINNSAQNVSEASGELQNKATEMIKQVEKFKI